MNKPSTSISKGRPFAMDVPVYDATKNKNVALTQLNASANSLRKAQEMLHQRGYDTSTNTQFLTADLQDGRQLVVPINHIVFQQNPESTNSQQPEL
ncbi:MAG: hypothetical protein GXP30_09050 [Verrucomicrobia bacterium]|nr:hypothetical protein [Verrucomicrobiota bacterium]